MCNNGCILPGQDYLQQMRSLCDEFGFALIFDEVITGFRLALGGAQSYFNVVPDLSIFAKALASGYPISVIAGKNEWMQPVVEGKVIHAGTMNSSNPTVAAALATIEILEKEHPYDQMFLLGRQLMNGLEVAAQSFGLKVKAQGPGPMFHFGFITPESQVSNYRDTWLYDKQKGSRFISLMHDQGIRIIGRGLWYISAVHTKEDILQAISAAQFVFGQMKSDA